jgi:hypothetical protein
MGRPADRDAGHPKSAGGLGGARHQFRIAHEHARRGVRELPRELWCGEPEVERDHDRADPGQGVCQHDVRPAVPKEQRDSLAFAHAQRGELARRAAGPAIELGERPPDVAGHKRKPVRGGARLATQPVRYQHRTAPRRHVLTR